MKNPEVLPGLPIPEINPKTDDFEVETIEVTE
jgi:hypothetical protein